MSLFQRMQGNASEVSAEEAREEFAMILADGEKIERAYVLVRDMMLFTNKRVVFVDKQGVTGKKTEFLSIPYAKITRFSVETAGTMDLDSEIRLWVSGAHEPVQKQFSRGLDVHAVHRLLAEHV